MRSVLLPLASLVLSAVSSFAGITKGKIDGAKYMIATPEKWQGKLILIAHGYRSAESPLDAEFNVTERFPTAMLEQGWAIASTSYRRNGWIVKDAVSDLQALRDHVAKEEGKIERCILVGSSMGGLIGTLIAEGAIKEVHGVVAIGAFLGDREKGGFYPTLTYKPAVPLIYLTNETELGHPQHYRKQEGGAKTALWEIKRPGHCNVSDDEELAGVMAVNGWIDGKAPEKERDATIAPQVRESTATKVDGGLASKINFVTESWGNLSTDFVAADLETLGLKIGDKATVKSGGKSLVATVARYWSEVNREEAAIYVTPSGRLGVVINGGRAAEALGVKVGDAVELLPVK